MSDKIRAGTVIWGHISGFPWWPGLVVPYETVLFLPPDVEVPSRNDDLIVVQWFSDGRISQLSPKHVEPYQLGHCPASLRCAFDNKVLDKAIAAADTWIRNRKSKSNTNSILNHPYK